MKYLKWLQPIINRIIITNRIRITTSLGLYKGYELIQPFRNAKTAGVENWEVRGIR
jgi:hypothetical protein